MNSTNPRTTRIDHLDFHPTCDARGNTPINPKKRNCSHPAEFTAILHECDGPGRPALFCATHLAAAATWFTCHVSPDITAYGHAYCNDCGHKIYGMPDWLWGVQNLR